MTEKAYSDFQEFDDQAVLSHFLSAEQVDYVFGQRILEYTVNLCQGKFDYLERLADDILLKIVSYLQLKDIPQLAQTSNRFRKVRKSSAVVFILT